MYSETGADIPVPSTLTATVDEAGVALTALSFSHGHQATTSAGRFALCAMALAIIVRVAARMPSGTRERKALARAAAELREVV